MKKIAAVFTLALTLTVSGVTAFAAPAYRQMNYAYTVQNTAYTAPQPVAYDDAALVENYIAALEARKAYLKDMYDKGLITKNRYDLSISVIQENINYIMENGLDAPYNNYGGYGGCCGWGW